MVERDLLTIKLWTLQYSLFQHRKGSVDIREILRLVVVNRCCDLGFTQPNHNSIFFWNDENILTKQSILRNGMHTTVVDYPILVTIKIYRLIILTPVFEA